MLKLWFIANSLLWPFNVHVAGLSLGLNVVLLSLIGAVWIYRHATISVFTKNKLGWVVILLLFSSLSAIFGFCADNFQKFIFTAPVFCLMICVGLELGWRATESQWLNLEKTARWLLLVVFATFLFQSLMMNVTGYSAQGKFSGFFAEPSHVAISIFPSVVILLVSSNISARHIGMLAIVGLLIFSRSTSLIALIFAYLTYQVVFIGNLKFSKVPFFLLIAVAGVSSFTNYEQVVAPVIDRFFGVVAADEFKNVSSLVYLQGWQDAWVNLMRTNGLGLGFNMMGCMPLPDVPARQMLAAFNMDSLNATDGSFLFAKFISEFGVVGILIFLSLVWRTMLLGGRIRTGFYGERTILMRFFVVLLFISIITFILRGAGYFGTNLMLVVAIAGGVAKLDANNKKKFY